MASAKQIVDGLTILMKYDPCKCVAAEHDIFFACGVKPGVVGEEDARALEALGWHWSNEGECWARFT